MSGLLVVEQCLNGLQFGVMLFLMAAGLTLVFGIMNLVNLAHGFGLRVVAEGVETAQEADALRAMGADVGQGYLFARPLTPAALRDLLTTPSSVSA